MAKKEDKVFVIYVIAFIVSSAILSDDAPLTTNKGVKICGNNYDCGETDGVCPVDYGTDCVVEDPDCG